jgi:ankyrin repeat protein
MGACKHSVAWWKLHAAGSVAIGAMLLSMIVPLAGCGERSAESKGKDAPSAGNATSFLIVRGPASEVDAQLLAVSGSGDLGQVEQALAAGGDVNASDGVKRTPLFAAAFRNYPQLVTLLASKGANFNARDIHGWSALHAAVAVGGAEALRALLDSGADINMRTEKGRTPLHLAAATNQAAIVDLLLHRGANTRIRDSEGLTAAGWATRNGHPGTAATIREWQASHPVR